MLKLKKVAVTGSIASGKTTVCQMFQECGAYVISADALVHQFLSPSHPLAQRVIELLGTEIVNENELDRRKIADIVFSDPAKLEKLEKLLHPDVSKAITNAYQALAPTSYPLFVAEVPLLYEAGFESDFDTVITVEGERRGGEKGDVARREKRLFSSEERRTRADIVIENKGTLEELRKQVKQTFNRLIA